MYHCKLQDIKLRFCRPLSARNEEPNDVAYDWFGTDLDSVIKKNRDSMKYKSVDKVSQFQEFSSVVDGEKVEADKPSQDQYEYDPNALLQSFENQSSARKEARLCSDSPEPRSSSNPPNEYLKVVMKQMSDKVFS